MRSLVTLLALSCVFAATIAQGTPTRGEIIVHCGKCVLEAGHIGTELIGDIEDRDVTEAEIEKLAGEVRAAEPDCMYFKYLSNSPTCDAAIENTFKKLEKDDEELIKNHDLAELKVIFADIRDGLAVIVTDCIVPDKMA